MTGWRITTGNATCIVMHMDIRFATGAEAAEWSAKVLANPDGGNVFQGEEFADQKRLTGWTPRFVIAGNMALTVHEKPVFGLGKLWYLPKGPGVRTAVQLGDLLPDLRTFAEKNGVFAVKVEPELEKTDAATAALRELGLIATTAIQPNASTVLIDLSSDLDTILMSFNQKGRHALRRAERDGVTVETVVTSGDNCLLFYELLRQTAEGQGFSGSVRPFEYYQQFWQRYAAAGLGQLFFAYHEGRLIAGAFAVVFGEKSTYKDGASIREKTAYGASHLLQWHVMQWAKSQGSLVHDLCGAPPSDRINDETHPHYGVGRFKTSFNKHVTDYIGAYDLVVRPRQYGWWARFGERITLRLWRRNRGESWY